MACWYFPPGANLSVHPDPRFTAEERKQLGSTQSQPRIAIYNGGRGREFLADARWTLELDRQRRANSYTYEFGELVNMAVPKTVRGPGSAVVWHCLPNIKDADLASAYLIESRLGRQFGDLNGPYGVMLRTDRPAPDPETLPLRLVIVAAMFSEGFKDALTWSDSLNGHLDQLHPDARGWWTTLEADDDFEHLRKSLHFYIPSADAVSDLLELRGQAQAWRGWETHFYITHDYALSLLAEAAS
jgi:hypothetical protein